MISFKFNQVKNVVFILFAFILVSCSEKTKINDYYSGIVIDELGRPVEGVLVKEDIQKPLGSEAVTDKNGFFKFFYHSSADLTISKEGYISDTIVIVYMDRQGETYSPLVTEDSSKVVIIGENISNLKLSYNEINEPSDYSINYFKFNKDDLFGIWLKNGAKGLDGFKISEKELYAFGYKSRSSERYLIYTIYDDTIILYYSYKYNLTGIIQKLDNENLEINWEGIGVEKYKKWRPD